MQFSWTAESTTRYSRTESDVNLTNRQIIIPALYFQIHFLSDSMNVFRWFYFSNAFLIHTQGPPTVWSKLKCCRKTQCRSWAKQWWDRASLASGWAGRRWMESDVWWPAAPSVMLKTAASKVNLSLQRDRDRKTDRKRERRETREREGERESDRHTERQSEDGGGEIDINF